LLFIKKTVGRDLNFAIDMPKYLQVKRFLFVGENTTHTFSLSYKTAALTRTKFCFVENNAFDCYRK